MIKANGNGGMRFGQTGGTSTEQHYNGGSLWQVPEVALQSPSGSFGASIRDRVAPTQVLERRGELSGVFSHHHSSTQPAFQALQGHQGHAFGGFAQGEPMNVIALDLFKGLGQDSSRMAGLHSLQKDGLQGRRGQAQ